MDQKCLGLLKLDHRKMLAAALSCDALQVEIQCRGPEPS